MLEAFRYRFFEVSCLFIAAACVSASGCASDSHAAKGASQGATTGAVAGAVGGMMTALVFGGNVAEAGARGAVYGGTTGAVAGGMSGSRADKAEAERAEAQRLQEIEEFRRSIGNDAYNGVVALAECKHEIALANAREAIKTNNAGFSLAGQWLEVLTETDRGNAAAAQALLPDLAARDSELADTQAAEVAVDSTMQKLRQIRSDYDIPVDCTS